MLTRKQLDLLRFIHERMGECGIPPSFDEMKDALDLRSKSGIHRLIIALEERGFIRRLPNRARAIEVIRMPEIAKTPLQSSKFDASITSEKFSYSINPKTTMNERPPSASERSVAINASSSGVLIPVMGRISAGTPISAIQNNSHSISLPPDLLTSGEHFALEVRGDSMVDAGILDGDTVILRRQDNADTGDIIVALIDDEEATLKRLRKNGSSIALEAANPAYETRVLGPNRVRIQGKLISLVRRY